MKAFKRQFGFTFLEILIVVLILGVIALIAIPSSRSHDSFRAEYVANEIKSLITFARKEAIRQNTTIGVSINRTSQEAYVHEVNITVDPFTIGNDIINPADKRSMRISIDNLPGIKGAIVSNSSAIFSFTGLSGNKDTILFTPQGNPIFIDGFVQYPLQAASIMIQFGDESQTVVVQPNNARVTLS